jgi:hypothetical protein
MTSATAAATLGVRPGPLAHLRVDAGRQDAAEQEERQHDHPLRPERAQPVEPLGHGGFGEGYEGRFDLANAQVTVVSQSSRAAR